MLADAGIPLGCQTVLLKGVNDDPAVMKQLMQKLLIARVRPYYIYSATRWPAPSTSARRSRRASRSYARCAAGPAGSRCPTS